MPCHRVILSGGLGAPGSVRDQEQQGIKFGLGFAGFAVRIKGIKPFEQKLRGEYSLEYSGED